MSTKKHKICAYPNKLTQKRVFLVDMKHLDLFSGIGGFALAADRVFGNVEHIFCEIDPFCQEVLKKHWPQSKIYGDIRTLTHDTESRGRRLRTSEDDWKATPQEHPSSDSTFLLTGGFPCQPFSQAGRRKGTDDDRHLWPEMFRVIREFKPTWVIAENVRGILTIEQGMVFEQVCLDLEGEGYEVQPIIIPAVAVNAPHRRDRVWFVANRKSTRARSNNQRLRQEFIGNSGRKGTAFADTGRIGQAEQQQQTAGREQSCFKADTHLPIKGRTGSGGEDKGRHRQSDRNGSDQRWDWSKNWIEVATELCSVDDGLPAELGDFTCTKAQHRNRQLKAYGNAIVPQVAAQIMQSIAYNQ